MVACLIQSLLVLKFNLSFSLLKRGLSIVSLYSQSSAPCHPHNHNTLPVADWAWIGPFIPAWMTLFARRAMQVICAEVCSLVETSSGMSGLSQGIQGVGRWNGEGVMQRRKWEKEMNVVSLATSVSCLKAKLKRRFELNGFANDEVQNTLQHNQVL